MIPGIDPKIWRAVADLLSERGALPSAADVMTEAGCAESEAYKAIHAYARYHALSDTVASVAEHKPTAATITPRQVWEAAFATETAVRRALSDLESHMIASDDGSFFQALQALRQALDLAREATRRALLAIPGPEQRQRGASWRL